MNKDQVKGKVKDVAGRVERQTGEWTGDKEHEAHGALEQAEGKVQNAWGNVKEAGKEATEKRSANETDGSLEEENKDDVRSRKAS